MSEVVMRSEDGRVHLRVLNSDSAGAAEEIAEHTEKITRAEWVRGRTISIKRLSKRELERGRLLYPEVEYDRPTTREDCTTGAFAERPCPFVSCKYHLFLDVSARTGAIKMNFPNLEVADLPESCALDIADRAGLSLEEIGNIMHLTRERIRQLEAKGLAKLKSLNGVEALEEFIEHAAPVRAVERTPEELAAEVKRRPEAKAAERVERERQWNAQPAPRSEAVYDAAVSTAPEQPPTASAAPQRPTSAPPPPAPPSVAPPAPPPPHVAPKARRVPKAQPPPVHKSVLNLPVSELSRILALVDELGGVDALADLVRAVKAARRGRR